jgi:hypothetical protein
MIVIVPSTTGVDLSKQAMIRVLALCLLSQFAGSVVMCLSVCVCVCVCEER